MAYTTFSQTKNDQLLEPMFFGQPVNVARYDQQKYDIFEKLIEKQLSFFWRPEEVDVSRDRIDFQALPEHEKHIFISNLKYQTLLDSIQGRSPNVALLPLISIPELETWVETWAFSETIHSRSYTHIIRNIVNDPATVFDDIVTNEQIQKRAEGISHYYDSLIEMTSWPSAGNACLMEFSTNGWIMNAGTMSALTSSLISTSTRKRSSPKRACSSER